MRGGCYSSHRVAMFEKMSLDCSLLDLGVVGSNFT